MPLRQLVDRRIDFGGKAPITEALVDIQLPGSAPADLNSLNQLKSSWGKEYPKGIRTQTEWKGLARYEEGGDMPTITSEQGIKGYIFLSEKNDQALQARKDGFAFSILRPYSSWLELMKKTKGFWKEYAEVVAPPHVSRVALRYTNQILLPEDRISLSEWLESYPQSPSILGTVSDFFIKTVITHPDDPKYKALTTVATITTPLGDPSPPSMAPSNLLIDIDVFVEQEFSDDQAIWNALEDLHTFKNDVFFSSITSRTIDLLRS